MRPLSAPSSLAVREALLRLLSGKDLSRLQLQQAIADLLSGEAPPAQVGALAALLRIKPRPDEELAVALEAFRARTQRLSHPLARVLSCSTPGCESTHAASLLPAVALVCSAAGLPTVETVQEGAVRGAGSVEVLEALGVPLELDPSVLGARLARHQVAFAPAQALLPGLRHLLGGRVELGFISVFQLLASLLDPAGAQVHLVGGHDPAMLERVARLMARSGNTRCWVVRGLDGLDALSPSGPSEVASIEEDGHIRLFTLSPSDAGLATLPTGALEGGGPADQARALSALLAGEDGPLRTAVLLNAAGALFLAGMAPSLAQGAELAARAIDSGAAMGQLAALTGR